MEKDELIKKLEKKIDDIRDFTNNLYEKLDELGSNLDGIYSELVRDVKGDESEKRLTKKQRKEMVLKSVKEKCPNLVKMFDEFDLFVEGFSELIEDKRNRLEDIGSELDEIEQMEDEIQERKERLDI